MSLRWMKEESSSHGSVDELSQSIGGEQNCALGYFDISHSIRFIFLKKYAREAMA